MLDKRRSFLLSCFILLSLIAMYCIHSMSQNVRNSVRRYKAIGSIATPRAEELRHLSTRQLLKPRTFGEYRAEFDGVVEKAIRLGEFGGANAEGGGLLEAACVRGLRGGKRLRPIIAMEIARKQTEMGLADRDPSLAVVDPANAALAIEYLHAASMIIDDLPEFDNDTERRGEETVWRSTSPAVAKMAALSMVASAIQNICHQVDWIRHHSRVFGYAERIGLHLCGMISQCLGSTGAAGGQVMDQLASSDLNKYGENAVAISTQKKTSPFFEIAFVSGWLLGGGDSTHIAEIQKAGRCFGIAFQIADDIGDMAQDHRRHLDGKPGWNYANTYGHGPADHEMMTKLAECQTILQRYRLFTPVWDEIYDKVWSMTASGPI